MLKPEQARAELEKVRYENGEKRRLSALARLPAKLAGIGRVLLGRDARGKPFANWEARAKAVQAARGQLDRLVARDRQKLFDALFPKLGPTVEAAWQLARQLPYEVAFDRKSFRAPHDPALSQSARGSWLESLLEELEGYEQDVTWLAAWAGFLSHGYSADATGVLLAAAVNQRNREGDAVFDILCESARGNHPVGGMGRHITRALLVASRPEGWEFMEKLLLAAQRQEGLRQTILESIDEAHPEAFRRMLHLILDHDLARFSSTVRAMNVWFGFQWDSVSTRVVNRVLERVVQFLEDAEARTKALKDAEAETVYLALWSLAFEDAAAAVKPAAALLGDPDVERRFIAAHLLGQLQTPAARAKLLPAIDDADLRVALCALAACEGVGEDEEDEDEEGPARSDLDLFEPLQRLLARLPEKKRHLEPIVWPWQVFTADREVITAGLVNHLGKRPPTVLIPYLPDMESSTRRLLVHKLAGLKKWDAQTRDTLFALAGDSSITVREAALAALANCKVSEVEAVRLEDYLSRKAGDLRRGVLTLLLNQNDVAALASADRLLASSALPQRQAGLELLRQLTEAKRVPDQCRTRAEKFAAGRPHLSAEEQQQLEFILDAGLAAATLDNALGLMDPAQRSRPVPPKKRAVTFMTPAAQGCLKALDALIHEHRNTTVVLKDEEDEEEATVAEESPGPKKEYLLGEISYGFPSPRHDIAPEKDVARLLLREVWEGWWKGRGRELRDRDGLELLRARMWHSVVDNDEYEWADWRRKRPKARPFLDLMSGGAKLKEFRYHRIVGEVIEWLLRLHPPRQAVDFLLDAVETSFALVPKEEPTRVTDPEDYDEVNWRGFSSPFLKWLELVRSHQSASPGEWTAAQHARLWGLLRWQDEPAPDVPRNRPYLQEVFKAFQAGAATEADLFDQLLGPRPQPEWGNNFDDLERVSKQKLHPEFQAFAILPKVVDRCRERILQIELKRGDTPTAASLPALALSTVWGTDALLKVLRALGKDRFHRGSSYQRNLNRGSVFTHLVQVCYPTAADTPEVFTAKVAQAGVGPQRLIDLAFTAPQWVRHVEHALGWPAFAEGVWWFLAHAGAEGDEDYQSWEALIRERTALTMEELGEGAVDVGWFHRTYEALGADRWQQLHEAARYGVSGNSHKRAQFLAEVLLGKADKAELVKAVRDKHLREAVRNLGLMPLAAGKARDADLLDRYHVLHEYLRYARQLGSMSREGAVRTAEVGLANLARTAGYPDPVRLEWDMEAEAVADLAKGPVTVRAAGVDVSLSLDEQGQPEVTASRDGKPLKSIPAAARKDPRVKELTARKADIKRQGSRMRQSLEQAMVRGDTFTAAELRRLCAHPVLAPRLERLVLVGEDVMGYPAAGGKALRDHAGKLEPVKKDEVLRLAHPYDLLKGRAWHQWQHDCFAAERVQPFKQVFRELYVLTDAEKKDGTISRRYAGQQVNPRQAVALWTARGWVAGEGEGVRRTFHDAGLSAEVVFLGDYFTPAEVEGATLEGVHFVKRGEWKPLPLTAVPPRLFSEVMRDLDLVVSVAHRGGVDPEASASTVEMRAALLKETCSLLKLANVRFKDAHVLIAGQLGDYSVHLGSGVVHRQPGGALCIVPVHAQHRGRLFLPFADDDPKTAEVISKVLLLARDEEIQDPGILDQLRAAP
jgi:hypothetical protein